MISDCFEKRRLERIKEFESTNEKEIFDDNWKADCDNFRFDGCSKRYAGTYAQEVMGYTDDDIDTVFDGEPDAYWNID